MKKIEYALYETIKFISIFLIGNILLVTSYSNLIIQCATLGVLLIYLFLGRYRIEYLMTSMKRRYVITKLHFASYLAELIIYSGLIFLIMIQAYLLVIIFFIFDYLFDFFLSISIIDIVTFTRTVFVEGEDAFEI